jgi:glycerol uptake facilitator-like aquaporin
MVASTILFTGKVSGTHYPAAGIAPVLRGDFSWKGVRAYIDRHHVRRRAGTGR